MEVEVKLRLPNSDAHAKVAALLKPSQEATYFQENIFFDGANKELSNNRVTLRVRFYNNDAKCVVTVKGKSVLVDGIGRSPEEEVQIEPQEGRTFVDNPGLLRTSTNSLIAKVRENLKCEDFVCVGGFKNIRMVFGWNDHKIELDETQFPFGTAYEVECETDTPEKLKEELEVFLRSNGIPFSYSQASKFATFRAGKLLD